ADRGGGIAVYDLKGRQLQFRNDGKLNNVDLRAGMPLGGQPAVVVVASNRTDNSLAFYRLDPASRQLTPAGARTVPTGFEPYGICMYRSKASGKFYVFVTRNGSASPGTVDQYELLD